MPARRATSDEPPRSRRPPATTPDARENQLISAAVDLAERQLADGTASAQVITHFLKLGSSRERLEQLRLEAEVGFMQSKQEQMESTARQEELYAQALDAMRAYSGNKQPRVDDDFED